MLTPNALPSLAVFPHLDFTGYWIVRVPFPSLLNSLNRHPPICFSPDFATTVFVLTTEHTERLPVLLNQQHRLIRVTHLTIMRQCDMVFGILLIFSIIDFAPAAPISIPENCQTFVLGKRGNEALEKVAGYFEKLGLGDPHASSISTPPVPQHELMNDVQASGSAPSGPEHGSINDEQALAQNSAPSTANLNPLVEAPSLVSTPTSSEYGSDSEYWKYYGNDLEGLGYQEVHVYRPDSGPSQQVNHAAHGTQMDDVQPPQPQWHVDDVQQQVEPPSPSSELSELGHFWNNVERLGDPAYEEVHVHQPDAGLSQQANNVANGHQPHPGQGLPLQENDMPNEHQGQVDDMEQRNQYFDQEWQSGLWG